MQPDDSQHAPGDICVDRLCFLRSESSGLHSLQQDISGCIWPVPHLQLPSPHISKNPWKCSSNIYFQNPMAENSIFFMKHGMRNGINPAKYQSPMRLRGSTVQSSSIILLDTLLLTENEGDKTEEQISYV